MAASAHTSILSISNHLHDSSAALQQQQQQHNNEEEDSQLLECTTRSTYRYSWKLNRAIAKFKQPGERMESPVFRTDQLRWKLHFYPAGLASGGAKGYALLRVYSLDSGNRSDDSMTLTSGKKPSSKQQQPAVVTSTHVYRLLDWKLDPLGGADSCGTLRFQRHTESSELAKFVKVKRLLDDRRGSVFSDDSLTVQAEITLESDLLCHAGRRADQLQQQPVERRFKGVVNDERYSDVTFIVEGKRFYGHRVIFATCSEVFTRMFATATDGSSGCSSISSCGSNNNNNNNNNSSAINYNIGGLASKGNNQRLEVAERTKIPIDNLDYSVFLEVCRFVYTGEFKSSCCSVESARQLLKAAHRFELHELKRKCARFLCQRLSVENVIECLRYADRCDSRMLREAAIDFVIEHEDMFFKAEFNSVYQLGESVVVEILRKVAKRQLTMDGRKCDARATR